MKQLSDIITIHIAVIYVISADGESQEDISMLKFGINDKVQKLVDLLAMDDRYLRLTYLQIKNYQ